MSQSPIPDRRAAGACPLCGASSASRHAPFCGQGCRDRDLLNWLGEGYRIPGRPAGPSPAEDPDDA